MRSTEPDFNKLAYHDHIILFVIYTKRYITETRNKCFDLRLHLKIFTTMENVEIEARPLA